MVHPEPGRWEAELLEAALRTTTSTCHRGFTLGSNEAKDEKAKANISLSTCSVLFSWKKGGAGSGAKRTDIDSLCSVGMGAQSTKLL